MVPFGHFYEATSYEYARVYSCACSGEWILHASFFTKNSQIVQKTHSSSNFHTLIPFRSHAYVKTQSRAQTHTRPTAADFFLSLHCTCVYIVKPILFLFTRCTRVCVRMRNSVLFSPRGCRRPPARHISNNVMLPAPQKRTHTLFALEFYYIA